jgi:FSR family fosmidomycin resistance protein-like MFS transporter
MVENPLNGFKGYGRRQLTMATSQAEIMSQAQTAKKVTVYSVLFAISMVHMLNDSIQSVIPAIFPILKDSMSLSYVQIGLIAFCLNITASIIQPLVGLYTDSKPSPYLLPTGMVSTFLGLVGLAFAPNYYIILSSVVLVGIGSAVFHPEGSRVAYMAAGGQRGLAQSIFQVGGNFGQSIAPILTILIFVRLGQFGAIWFTILAAIAIGIQLYIAKWYQQYLKLHPRVSKVKQTGTVNPGRRKQVGLALGILVVLMFSKSWYGAGITNYYPFYLIEVFGLTVEKSQIYIFIYLISAVIGGFLGGPLADRLGRRNVIWFSILGASPFALLLPYSNLMTAYILLMLTGIILSSSFSVIIVYAQELLPGKVGTVSGLFFGLAFGLGGIGSVALGGLADSLGITFVMQLCGFLPFLGLLTLLLPSNRKIKEWDAESV